MLLSGKFNFLEFIVVFFIAENFDSCFAWPVRPGISSATLLPFSSKQQRIGLLKNCNCLVISTSMTSILILKKIVSKFVFSRNQFWKSPWSFFLVINLLKQDVKVHQLHPIKSKHSHYHPFVYTKLRSDKPRKIVLKYNLELVLVREHMYQHFYATSENNIFLTNHLWRSLRLL